MIGITALLLDTYRIVLYLNICIALLAG